MFQKKNIFVIAAIGIGVITALIFLNHQEGGVVGGASLLNWFPKGPSENVQTKKNSITTFTHLSLGFSFNYPSDFKIGTFAEGEGQVVLGQNQKTKETCPSEALCAGGWFQFFTTEFDEEGPLTSERIKKDLPDMVIENPQEILIGKEKNIPALLFSSENQTGKTREVWFVYNEYMFQVSTAVGGDNLIGPIMDSFTY